MEHRLALNTKRSADIAEEILENFMDKERSRKITIEPGYIKLEYETDRFYPVDQLVNNFITFKHNVCISIENINARIHRFHNTVEIRFS